MEFGLEKWASLIMKSWKRQMVEGIELPNQEKIRKLGEKETYKYLGISKADSIKHAEMREKVKKNISQEREKQLETKLHRNLIKEINTWAVYLVKKTNSGTFLKWTWEELQQIHQKTRKLITMHKTLHPSDDTDRQCVQKRRSCPHSR